MSDNYEELTVDYLKKELENIESSIDFISMTMEVSKSSAIKMVIKYLEEKL